MNVKTPSQKMGVMSTPKAGGIVPRTAFNNGSVGNTAKIHGISFTFVAGYQLNTTLKIMAKDIKFNNGSKNAETGRTHGSVSERMTELEAAPAAAAVLTASTADAGSIIISPIVDGDEERSDDSGGKDELAWSRLTPPPIGEKDATSRTDHRRVDVKAKISLMINSKRSAMECAATAMV